MKLRHTIKRLNKARRMYRRLFREAALNAHPTSRQERNKLVARAYSATASNPKYYRVLADRPIEKIKVRSKWTMFHRSKLHASKDTKFEILENGYILLSHLQNKKGQLQIGVLILCPEHHNHRVTTNP